MRPLNVQSDLRYVPRQVSLNDASPRVGSTALQPATWHLGRGALQNRKVLASRWQSLSYRIRTSCQKRYRATTRLREGFRSSVLGNETESRNLGANPPVRQISQNSSRCIEQAYTRKRAANEAISRRLRDRYKLQMCVYLCTIAVWDDVDHWMKEAAVLMLAASAPRLWGVAVSTRHMYSYARLLRTSEDVPSGP